MTEKDKKMGKLLDSIKNMGNNWDDWDDEPEDWDEELQDAAALEAEDGYYEEDADYEDVVSYEDDLVYEDDVVYEDGVVYEDDVVYEDGTVYEDDVVYEDGTVYEDDVVYEDGTVYEDDVVYEDGTVYEDDAVYEDGTVYEDDVVYEDGTVYEGDAVYEDDVVYEDDIIYEDELYADEYYEDDDDEKGLFAWFFRMSSMDKVMLATGVCVVLLAVVTLVAFVKSGAGSDQTKVFASVGTQLDGIDIVGDEGLLALSEAVRNKAEQQSQQEEEKDYGEADYNKNVTVALKTVSVQKDLKIKFVNKSSEKLIANVPFTVSVTDPDGKAQTWSDDDMDGIIHKKGITPGNYKLDVNDLSGDKYAGYAIPGSTVSAEVRKDIAYQKVDVSDEVKDESQIDVSQEEQKKPDMEEESRLEDTVEWVESTQVTNTYIEVPKSKITDPATLTKSGTFARMAAEVKLDKTVLELKLGGGSVALEGTYSDMPEVVAESWTSSDTSVAEVDMEGLVNPVAVGTATITYTVTNLEDGKEVDYKATCEVTVIGEEVKANAVLSVDKTSVSLAEKEEKTVQASVSEVPEDKSVVYKVSSADTGIAEASVSKSGKITITAVSDGQTVITVEAYYEENDIEVAPPVEVKVTVNKKGSISLDKKEATVYKGETATLSVTADEDAELSVKSSDEAVATVELDGKSVIITGEGVGTTTVKVTAKLGDDKVSATCAVTVMEHPKNDGSGKLKDNDGNQLYVQENDAYREAVYADYYKEDVKFFKKGETKYTGWQTLDGKVYFFDKHGKKVTGEQVIQGAKYTFDSDGVLMTGSGTMGIDVSKHNGTIDWNAVKNSGVSYVIIRCGYRGYTQGSLVIDPTFERNIKGATSAGLKVGVYFFSQAVDEVEAVEEASFVLDAVKNYKISYPIFLDVEYSGAAGNKGRADGLSKSARTAVCKAFCETIRSGGYTAGIYANKTWLESMIDPGQLGAYKIWLAQYAAAPTYTGRYDLWQYKCTGRVSGISGNVDMNLSYLGY